jgi:hypothetical protein
MLLNAGVRVSTTVQGTLTSTPSRSFRVEVFSNLSCDASGLGEGETYLGSVNMTTHAAGNGSFAGVFPLVPVGRWISATVTDVTPNSTTNGTSELGACKASVQAAVMAPPGPLFTTEVNEGAATDHQFPVYLQAPPIANVTIPVSISDPTEGTLVSTSTMTFTPANGTTSQIFGVLGVDDGIDDGNVAYTIVLGPAISADPNYSGLNPPDVPAVNADDDDQLLQCIPRPNVSVSVVKIGGGQLRTTVTVGHVVGRQNEIQSITWNVLSTAIVVLDGVGPVQQGQTTTISTPLTQSKSFTITRTPGAQTGTVRLTVNDACGDWPTFVGGGPNAW